MQVMFVDLGKHVLRRLVDGVDYLVVVVYRASRKPFCFQAEDGIQYLVRSRGLGDVYKRQVVELRADRLHRRLQKVGAERQSRPDRTLQVCAAVDLRTDRCAVVVLDRRRTGGADLVSADPEKFCVGNGQSPFHIRSRRRPV